MLSVRRQDNYCEERKAFGYTPGQAPIPFIIWLHSLSYFLILAPEAGPIDWSGNAKSGVDRSFLNSTLHVASLVI